MMLLLFAAILAAAGIVCIVLPLHIGVTGLCLLALAAVLAAWQFVTGKKHEKRVKRILSGLTVFGLIVAIGGTAAILACGQNSEITSAPDFVVVLGAQTYGAEPSRTLRERLDLATDYLEEHPNAVCFVSGGQGPDESSTEAQVMEKYLLANGIAANRVIKEEEASTTRENLIFSREMAEKMGIDTESVLIITSEYHLARAKYLAKSLGMEPYGLGSQTTPEILKLNYALREVASFVKAFAQTM